MTQQFHFWLCIQRKKKLLFEKTHASYSSVTYKWQNMEATCVSTNTWMGKEEVVYMYNGIPLTHKK